MSPPSSELLERHRGRLASRHTAPPVVAATSSGLIGWPAVRLVTVTRYSLATCRRHRSRPAWLRRRARAPLRVLVFMADHLTVTTSLATGLSQRWRVLSRSPAPPAGLGHPVFRGG